MKRAIFSVIIITIFTFNIQAQFIGETDECGCYKYIEKSKIIVPFIKDGVTIQFFYSKTGKFTYSDPDYLKPVFLSQVVYDCWPNLTNDFESVAFCTGDKTEEFTIIKFDWEKLATFGKHQNWETIVNKVGNKIYIGNFLDFNKNYDAKKIKIVDIRTSCFHPECSPTTIVFTVKVYLADK